MKHSALALGLLLSIVGCGRGGPIVEGGIYSIESGDGRFGVVKILKLEPRIVHLRVYKNKFTSRPTSINVEDLSMGGYKPGSVDKDFAIGHIPMRERDFRRWRPVLLTKTQVTESELEGYKIWKESGGGAFGR